MTGGSGGKLAELFVQIGTDQSKLDSGLSTARGKLKSFAANAASYLGTMFVADVGGKMAGWAKDAILGAGDLNESLSKTETVFGSANAQIVGFAENMADKFGSAKGEILDAASGFGLIFRGAGMAEQASADLAMKLATAADDAASLFNSELPEALEKIRAGLVGESEPLRAYGVMLNEAAVQQEALRLGLAKSKNELSESAKIMARASLIEKGLAVAKGDHAKTQGGLNNQLKEFMGRLTNLGTTIGSTLVGPLSSALQVVNAGIGAFGLFGDMLGTVAKGLNLVGNESAAMGANLANVFAGMGAASGVAGGKGKAGPSSIQVEASKRIAAEKVADNLDKEIALQKEKERIEKLREWNRESDVRTAIEMRRETDIKVGSDGKLHAPSMDAVRTQNENLLAAAKEKGLAALGLANQFRQDLLGGAGKALDVFMKPAGPRQQLGVTDSDSYARDLQDAALDTADIASKQLEEAKKQTSKLDEMLRALSGGARDALARFG